jgi:hypothetical protein
MISHKVGLTAVALPGLIAKLQVSNLGRAGELLYRTAWLNSSAGIETKWTESRYTKDTESKRRTTLKGQYPMCLSSPAF